jgi:hypothetical protein
MPKNLALFWHWKGIQWARHRTSRSVEGNVRKATMAPRRGGSPSARTRVRRLRRNQKCTLDPSGVGLVRDAGRGFLCIRAAGVREVACSLIGTPPVHRFPTGYTLGRVPFAAPPEGCLGRAVSTKIVRGSGTKQSRVLFYGISLRCPKTRKLPQRQTPRPRGERNGSLGLPAICGLRSSSQEEIPKEPRLTPCAGTISSASTPSLCHSRARCRLASGRGWSPDR